MIPTRVSELLGIRYPVIQGGMIWTSGWKLAAAVSNAGGLGLIGSASMKVELLREHIRKAKAATQAPFGVNVAMLYKDAPLQVACALEEGVKIIFTSAGNPKSFTNIIKPHATWVHVSSLPSTAKKCEDAGCDAVVVEGTEAGGHNGRDELTTFVLVPMARKAVTIPLIAAGGIATGQAIAAALALGADGVQVGSRFAISQEASLHQAFKEAVVNAGEASTRLSMKKLVPVRLLRNTFERQVLEMEERGASKEDLEKVLGKGRAKLGMFEGNLEEGELEIGQVAGQIDSILTVQQIFDDFRKGYDDAIARLQKKK
jgi:enoyl-[acyl-carrier protein] reductase II